MARGTSSAPRGIFHKTRKAGKTLQFMEGFKRPTKSASREEAAGARCIICTSTVSIGRAAENVKSKSKNCIIYLIQKYNRKLQVQIEHPEANRSHQLTLDADSAAGAVCAKVVAAVRLRIRNQER
ncbi:MAG: hypothetical protein VB060_08600, partial [Oscillibacter sp.]